MRAALAGIALLAGTAVALGLGPGATPASACSLAPLHSRYFSGLVERSPVIAIGAWTDSREREATFIVEEGLKGAVAGARFEVDNRDTYTAGACSPYDEPFREGHRFVEGDRALLFLEKEVDGLWQVGWFSFAVYEVPPDDLAPLRMWGGWVSPEPAESLAAVLDVVRDAAARPTDADAIERRLGCEPPHGFQPSEIGQYASIADAVALVTVTGAPAEYVPVEQEPVQLRVDELIRGALPDSTVTMNDRWISDYERGNCEPTLELGRRGMREGDRYLVFLRPDEFEIGEYRPVGWGSAAIQVNDSYLVGPWPTFAELRALVAAELLSVPASADASPAPGEAAPELAAKADAPPGSSSRAGVIALSITAIVAVVAVALLVRSWRARRVGA